ncbi:MULTISPECIES: FAD-dependent oxidoreductase [unclassified Microbacterium]|uniref:FAD-dependent oxidoreductase n=1 Tax=unclassified Microbacterium TaxID=2609290 RepID=UPI001D237EA2|nr:MULTISPECIES: FAD-dependent oxidoreductase [unclassified Microbacterium]CAH0145035.1 Fumarate reductase flavoprotein subunit [Microbacterium sp. Bi121]HWK77847.1 FAD-dependent oxidoreductase [Microbacterium sp.]
MNAFDVIVIGSGIGGSSAAAAAARAGARVALLEKSASFGGSAALSAGMLWTAPDVESYRRRIPNGEIALGERVVADFADAIAEVRATGARVADEPTRDIMTFGIGYSTDIHAILAACRDAVTAAGGVIVSEAPVRELLVDAGRVVGAVAQTPNGPVEYRAPSVVLATGGFGRDPELLTRYVGPQSDNLLMRSHVGNVGDGLRMACAAGAGGSRSMASYYGHLVPWPLEEFEPEHYLPYSQYYSGSTVFVNMRGERFVDETLGDEIINQVVVGQPDSRGVLIFDEHVHLTEARSEPFPGLGATDRFETAKAAGGLWASADTIDGLVAQVAEWGVDAATLSATLAAYRGAAEAGGGWASGAPVAADARAPQTAPFHALMVQPSITFTFGGVPISTRGEALDPDGAPIPGLYAAGADIGGLSNVGYAGGLAPAYITGRWAGRSAARAALNETSQERTHA